MMRLRAMTWSVALTGLAAPAAGAQSLEVDDLQPRLPGPRIIDPQIAPNARPDLVVGVRVSGDAEPGETLELRAELHNIGDAPADLDQRRRDGAPIPMVQWAVLKPGEDLNDLFAERPGEGLETSDGTGDAAARRRPRTDFGSMTARGANVAELDPRLAERLRDAALPQRGVLATETMLGVLEPGRSLRLRLSYALPEEPPGAYRICAVVDPEDAIAEADESRNVGCAEAYVSVRPDRNQTPLEESRPRFELETPTPTVRPGWSEPPN